jgi:hypothetical protein
MAVTAAQYVSLLTRQKGIGESPPGSNHNKFTEWYWGKGTKGGAYAWCAVFTCWGFDQLDARNMIPWTASCSAAVRGWKERGQWLGATKYIRAGDIFYIPGGGTGYEHVGVVARVNSNGTFLSIEGNWKNAVMQVTRTISKYHYARPKYASTSSTTVPQEEEKMPTPQEIAKAVWEYKIGVGESSKRLGMYTDSAYMAKQLQMGADAYGRQNDHQNDARYALMVKQLNALSGALTALSAAMPATVQAAVADALKDAVVNVEVNVDTNDEENDK